MAKPSHNPTRVPMESEVARPRELDEGKFPNQEDEEVDSRGYPLALQVLCNLTDYYATDLCGVLDGVSSRPADEPMTFREKVRFYTAIYSIRFTRIFTVRKSFDLPPNLPSASTFFGKLAHDRVLQIQVSGLLKSRAEHFVAVEGEDSAYILKRFPGFMSTWYKVKKACIMELENLPDERRRYDVY